MSGQLHQGKGPDGTQAGDEQGPPLAQTQFRKIEDILAIDNGEAIVHNFDGDKMSQYRLMALATGGTALKFEDMKFPFDLKYWYASRVDMVAQQGGEILSKVRVALIDKNNVVVSFVSDGMVKELDVLRSMFGEGPYLEPMPLQVTKIITRKGNPTYSMGPA